VNGIILEILNEIFGKCSWLSDFGEKEHRKGAEN